MAAVAAAFIFASPVIGATDTAGIGVAGRRVVGAFELPEDVIGEVPRAEPTIESGTGSTAPVVDESRA